MELPKRKNIRLKEYDYSENGAYFITICTYNRRKILSNINVGEGLRALPSVELTITGEIVEEAINFINKAYKNITVDKYVIMPNHVHLLLSMRAGGHGDPPLQVYDIVGRMKSFTTYKYGKILWQRSFYDHVIRNENDYRETWEYIENNPFSWAADEFFSE